jgi:hypothetical protein
MSTYGRNFGFRVSPRSENRMARFAVPATGARLPIGAPVVANVGAGATALTAYPSMPVQRVGLAAAAAAPIKGQSGLLVYEFAPAAFAGFDEYLTTYSDLDTAPLGATVQVVDGAYVKVVLKNTGANEFLHNRTYAARNMVAPANLAGVAVGAYLTPGVGNDTAGYWAVGDVTNGWLVVTSVDATRGEVEARLTF